jgi:hypothetical protein
MRRKHIVIFMVVGLVVGFSLAIFGASMVIPAAWGAGGGDMPPGHGDPATMQVGQFMLYAAIGIALVGAALFVTSLIGGIVLLLTLGKNGE